MDEILIEEKKYVSSKRAAKITGYAKDYVGQLCREGRVPARLVGRSWYVLETAIEDHRFGEHGAEKKIQEELSVPAPSTTWESPRYETFMPEDLPSLPHLKDEVSQSSESNQEESLGVAHRLQDSWRAWFDHVEANSESSNPAPTPENMGKEEVGKEEPPLEEESEDNDVNVPIHVVYEPLPKELLPISTKDIPHKKHDQVVEFKEEGRGNALIARALPIVGVLVAAIFVVLAVINTGYLDKYITSLTQVSVISGITIYNR